MIKTRTDDSMLRVRGMPETLDEEAMTVQCVATTSAPAEFRTWYETYTETLRMDKVRIPKNGQVPLCDTHERYSAKAVIGSFRDIKVGKDKVTGTVHFSKSDPDAAAIFNKVKEGHLTDFSVGYKIYEQTVLRENQKQFIGDREYIGPCNVVTDWGLFELSICAIGVDPGAKTRMADLELDRLLQEAIDRRAAEEKPKDGEEKKSGGDEEEKPEEEEKDEAKGKGKKSGGDEEENKSGNDSEKAAQAERERVVAIMNLGRRCQFPASFADGLISSGASVREAQSRALAELTAARDVRQFPVSVIQDEGVNFRSRAIDAVAMKMGVPLPGASPGAADIASRPLENLAVECLRARGERIPTNFNQMISRALSSTDLPLFLIEGTHRVVMQGYAEAEETWQKWTGEMAVHDFRPVKLISLSMDNELKEIPPESGEYEYTGMAESAEEIYAKTYGRKFAITRYAIINDDLSQVVAKARELGRGVARHIAKSVYGVLNSNPSMSDGYPLFSDRHKNVLQTSAAGGVPNVDDIAKALKMMAEQTDQTGKIRLNIKPQFLLAPLAMSAAAETFFTSSFIGTAALPTTNNIYPNHFTRLYELLLDEGSPTTWYLVGPKNHGVLIAYLRGDKNPFIASDSNFETDSVVYKVRFDYGVKAVDAKNFIQIKAA